MRWFRCAKIGKSRRAAELASSGKANAALPRRIRERRWLACGLLASDDDDAFHQLLAPHTNVNANANADFVCYIVSTRTGELFTVNTQANLFRVLTSYKQANPLPTFNYTHRQNLSSKSIQISVINKRCTHDTILHGANQSRD